MMKALSAVLIVCLAATTAAFAQDQSEDSQDSLQILLDQQRDLQADLDDGGIEGLTARQNNAVRKAQKEVFAVTEGKSRLDELSMDEKIRLENALERINAEAGNSRTASDNQQVCWREAKSGSTIKVTRCGTQLERDQIREGARAWMEKPKVCVPPGCGG